MSARADYEPVIPFGTPEDQALLNAIDKIYTDDPTYGCRRITARLCKDGFAVGRKRLARAMKFMGIAAIYPKPRTSVPNKAHRTYPYLLEELKNPDNQVMTRTSRLSSVSAILAVQLLDLPFFSSICVSLLCRSFPLFGRGINGVDVTIRHFHRQGASG